MYCLSIPLSHSGKLPACRIDPSLVRLQMVTDLQNQWHLLWMNGNTLRRQSLKDNSHAAHAVKLALGVDAAIGEGDKAFVDRQRVPNERIPQQRAVKFEGLSRSAVHMQLRSLHQPILAVTVQ